MGTWRYYMTPEGVIKPAELPEKWGLLEVGNRSVIKPLAGPAALSKNSGTFSNGLDDWRHEPDHDAERDLLVLLLARVGCAESLNNRLKEVNNANQRLLREVQTLREKNRSYELSRFVERMAASTEPTP